LRRIALAFGVSLLAVLVVAGVAVAGWPVVVSLHGWPHALAQRYVLVLVLGSLVAVGWLLHDVVDDGGRSARRSRPIWSRWSRPIAWVRRVAIAPMMALGGVGLVRFGFPVPVVVCLAITAWISLDLAELAVDSSGLVLVIRAEHGGVGARGT
jgi:hypothetical protein